MAANQQTGNDQAVRLIIRTIARKASAGDRTDPVATTPTFLYKKYALYKAYLLFETFF